MRVQLPVALDDESEPEPDFSVFQGDPRETGDRIPAGPALIVEVAERSLAFDRGEKASLYARAGIPDYWIVDRVLEVYRQPAADPDAPFGWRYGMPQTLSAGAVIVPLAAPHAQIAVTDLLP